MYAQVLEVMSACAQRILFLMFSIWIEIVIIFQILKN